MHIAQIAPLTEAVPPKLYGGTERVIHWLTDELVALGHEVTLFASGDSRTAARLDAAWPRAIRHDESVRDPNALHMMMLERVHRRASDFDFMHFHLDYYPFSLFSRQPVPFITTLHGRLDLPEHQPVFTTFSRVPVVSISNAQRRPVPHAGWVTTIYHGLPQQLLTPVPGAKPQYLAFLGRIAAEKGVERAISIARQCGVPLRIAGVAPKVREERVALMLTLVGLADHARHRPGELSGGQQQRVAIARALATRPRVLLADEPTGQLDAETGKQIMRLLRSVVRSEGVTALLATHDPTLMDVADSVLNLSDGTIKQGDLA